MAKGSEDTSAEAFRETLARGFRSSGPSLPLGAALRDGTLHPDRPVSVPLALFDRHGLIAGATGTGKTRTVQGLAEKLSAAGVPVLVSDVKGDLSGLAAPGEATDAVVERARSLGLEFAPAACPVEFLSLTGRHGATVRATVADFGPLLLAKALALNDTQASVLAMVFRYADDQGLPLVDLADLRALLVWMAGDDAPDLTQYGGLARSTAGVLARKLTEIEAQGAATFFGEPAFDVRDLLRTAADGRGLVSVLELDDVQDRPRLFSTFLLWILAELYEELPERGDAAQPLLVFFFDEAHLAFDGASKALLETVSQVVRLIRSKGVGLYFVTQTPKDLPADVLGQLGHRVQHALRAYTPDDAKALRAAVRTFPRTPFYDLEEVLTTLATGEAVVSALGEGGAPAPVAVTRILPPLSRMAPLAEEEMARALAASPLHARLARAQDPESAREILARRLASAPAETRPKPRDTPAPASLPGRAPAPASPRPAPSSPPRSTPGGGIGEVAAATLGGLFRFATSRAGQRILRGVLGTPRRRSGPRQG